MASNEDKLKKMREERNKLLREKTIMENDKNKLVSNADNLEGDVSSLNDQT